MSLLDENTRAGIITRINNLSPEAHAQWGKMSVGGMLCHVTDQFRIMFGEKTGVSHAGFMGRTLLKFLVLYVMPIPKNVPTSPAVDQDKDGTPPTDFESDRKTLLGYVDKFAATPPDFAWAPHFKFGPMNAKEWAFLAAKHLDHHLKQFGA